MREYTFVMKSGAMFKLPLESFTLVPDPLNPMSGAVSKVEWTGVLGEAGLHYIRWTEVAAVISTPPKEAPE